MSANWRASTWGDEVTLEYGKALRGHTNRTGHCRVFGSNGAIGWTEEALAEGPGVILGRKGAYRGVEYSTGPFWVIDTAYYVVPKSKVDMRWLYYAIKYHRLGEIDDGSPIPSTTRAAVYVRELKVPPPCEQHAIASILGTLDDKIELNRRTNDTIQAMAQALFQSWFVDFDPVHAKAAGRQPAGMDAATAELFPSEFVESVLGNIPKGWSIHSLDEIADFRNGLALQNFRPKPHEDRLPVVKIADLRTGRPNPEEWSRADIDPSCVLDDGDVVFSWSGSLMVVVWCGGRAALNQHLFRVTSTTCPKSFYLGWLLHHLPEFQRIAADKATTMGHIKRRHLTAAHCAVPTSALLLRCGDILDGLLRQRVNLEQRSRSLAKLRDLLLPSLLSGAVSLKAYGLDANH